MRLSCKIVQACLFACLGLGMSGCAPSKYTAEKFGLFATDIQVTAYSASQAAFERGASAVFGRMEELHRIFDRYRAYDSITNLHTVNAQAGVAPVAVNGALMDLLLKAKEAHALTDGAVNVCLGPVLDLWRACREAALADPDAAALPDPRALRAAGALCDIDDLIIDEVNRTVFLRKPGMALDVGAIAKAYAAGLAAQAGLDAGLTALLINAGGNITAAGDMRDWSGSGRGWRVGIQNPDAPAMGGRFADTLVITEATVSCSGAYQRFFTVDGETYGHIIDPVTLMPPTRFKQVTVVHPDAWLADVLSTALFILPIEDGRRLAEQHGAHVMWMNADGGREATEGYAALAKRTRGDNPAND